MAGQIYVNSVKVIKAGTMISKDDKVELRGKALKYVSRGGLKLEKAIDSFEINLNGKICMDVGASTGGFTDCMLQNGAERVYSIDVGYGQLAWKLRCDTRVVNYERTNFRYLDFDKIGEQVDFATVDVSFISLSHIAPKLNTFLKDDADCVMLIKPQFEAGKEKVGKKGVIRDSAVHIEVINKILLLMENLSLYVKGMTYSPIKGPEGNIEYLIYVSKDCHNEEKNIDVEHIVAASHKELDAKSGDQL